MNLSEHLLSNKYFLTEGAIIEQLRRSGNVTIHPQLQHALLIYDESGKKELSRLFMNYISIAREAKIPIIICAPTWRANKERLENAFIKEDVNGDAVQFMKEIRDCFGKWSENILIGGLIGCQNDCYKPEESLSPEQGKAFHSFQINKLADAGVDFLLGATLPAVQEAIGIAGAMAETNIPYIISFVINRGGYILDGNKLDTAINKIDDSCKTPPAGYMINCSYPSFLKTKDLSKETLSRIIGFQANASSLDHSELDNSDTIKAEVIEDWGDLMIDLNKKSGLKILGGCCGTGKEHLQYIVDNI